MFIGKLIYDYFSSLRPVSHLVVWVVRFVQKDPKDKDSESEYPGGGGGNITC